MIKIKDKTKCCGCTACANACPKLAIKMLPDEEGFCYPAIDMDLCIDCGVCNKVCPVESKLLSDTGAIASYVLRTKDKDVLKNSTSGGFITPLAIYLLNHGGVICAASYDKSFKVKHALIETSGGGTPFPVSGVLSMCRAV